MGKTAGGQGTGDRGQGTGARKKQEGRRQATRARGQARVVKALLDRVGKKLRQEDAKATLGDYIKLVQLEKELSEGEQPSEIRVTWVEPEEKSPKDGE